jgi:hypothetical protein
LPEKFGHLGSQELVGQRLVLGATSRLFDDQLGQLIWIAWGLRFLCHAAKYRTA